MPPWPCTRTRTHTHTCSHELSHLHTVTQVRTLTLTHSHTYKHTHTHTHSHSAEHPVLMPPLNAPSRPTSSAVSLWLSISVTGKGGSTSGNTHQFPHQGKTLISFFCAKKSLFNELSDSSPITLHPTAFHTSRALHLSLSPHFQALGKQCSLHGNLEFTETAFPAFIYSSDLSLESP